MRFRLFTFSNFPASLAIIWWTNPLLGQLALVELARPFVGIICLPRLVGPPNEKIKRKLQAPSFKQQAMLDNGSGIV